MTTMTATADDVIDLTREERREDWRIAPLDEARREDRRLLRLAAAAALHLLEVRDETTVATA